MSKSQFVVHQDMNLFGASIKAGTYVRQKEWVGLTEEEMLYLIAYEPHPLANRTAIINAVERLLKEKNA